MTRNPELSAPRTAGGISALTLYLLFLGYVFALLALARLFFYLHLAPSLADAPGADQLRALYIGLRFDARWAAIITFPLGLVLTLRPLGRRLRRHKNLVFAFYVPVFFLLLAAYIFDAGFFAYLGERLNATIIELAKDTATGATMLMESYPVIPIFAGALLLVPLCAWPMRRLAALPLKESRGGFRAALRWLAAFLLFAIAAYGQLSSNFFPLRWSHAYFSPNPKITALGLNPLQNLYDTYQATLDDGFDLAKTRAVYPLMAEYLQVDHLDSERLNYTRLRPAKPVQGRRPNVIILILESFGYPKSSFAPGGSDHTPALKTLAGESVYFPHFFSNARTTARGVFSTLTGIPDVTASSAGPRNPRVIDQRIIANEFEGYSKYYLLGGSTAWANIRGLIGNNIQGVRILEEGYWKAPNTDVWGVSDYHLLMEAHDLFVSLGDKPFLAVIQTASFHKPFAVPDGLPGFAPKPLDEETKRMYGFVSEDEYNSLRYMDYSVGAFFAQARTAPYYADTVFFIFGDHGISDLSANTTDAYKASDLHGWHVPLIVHAPGRLAPGLREDEASQADVFPSAAGLAGIAYANHTLGRDLFDPAQNQKRGAFISGGNDAPIRLVMDGYCFFDNRAGGLALYRLEDTQAVNRQKDEPERFERMRTLAGAIQTTAKYWLYNNKKSP